MHIYGLLVYLLQNTRKGGVANEDLDSVPKRGGPRGKKGQEETQADRHQYWHWFSSVCLSFCTGFTRREDVLKPESAPIRSLDMFLGLYKDAGNGPGLPWR